MCVGLWIAVTQFSISGRGVVSRKGELFAQVTFHSNMFFPKCVHNLDSEVLGSADAFLPAGPHAESRLVTEVLYGCGVQGNRLHS